MGTVQHIEDSKENTDISPRRLLEIALTDIDSGERTPTSLLILMIEQDGTDDTIYTYRSNLPIDREQCLMANQLFRLQQKRVL